MQIKTLKSQFRLWTVLLVVVPSLLVMAIYTVYQIKVTKQDNLKLISQRIHAQEILIDYWMAERSGEIQKLTQLEAFRRLDKKRMKSTLSVMQQGNKNFDSLSYIDKKGLFKISTLSHAIKYPSTIGQPYFAAAAAGKEYISDVVVGRNSGLPIINFSAPIFDYEGNFQGLLLGSVRTTTLELLLRNNWFGETGEVYLINRERMLLSEPRESQLFIEMGLIKDTAVMKLKISDDASQNILIGESGTATWISRSGHKVIGAYLDIPERGWTIVGKINEEEVLSPIYKQLAIMAGGTILIVFLIIPLATLITNRIKRPLDWLVKQSELIAAEQYEMVGCDKHPKNIAYELDRLCNDFVNMSRKTANTVNLLRKNETELEYKVHERTIALLDMNVALEAEIAKHQAANTALKESRDALAISESRYKDLFDYMHNGCAYYKVLFDEDENPVDLEYIHVNHAYEKSAGYLAAELIGKRRTEIFPDIDEDIVTWVKMLIKVALSGEAVKFTQHFKHQKQTYAASAYIPAKGYVAVLSEDITKYVDLQKEVAQIDRLSLIGNMAAGLAHEIRNPLTVIKGYLQYFKRKIPSGLLNQIELVLDELARIEMIITDFLAIAKTTPTEPKLQDINGIINNLAPLLQTDALKRGMNLEFKLASDIPLLLLAEKEIKQLLLNLAMNGLNAMEKNGTLTIETKYQENAVILCIDDCGCGIAKELQTKIFDPFFTTRAEGTGLGLSVCASVVAGHNGTIEVQSEEGKGTCFILTFRA